MDAETLRDYLEQQIGKTIHLTLTRNRRVFISRRTDRHGTLLLRLHEIFLFADRKTLTGIKCFLVKRNTAEARRRLRVYFDAHASREVATPRPPRTRRMLPTGRFHDLEAIRTRVNERCFDSRVTSDITWGRRAPARRRRRIRLGSYDFNTDVITVHPLLDQQRVPGCVVEQTVHHEMLHAVLGVARNGGRRVLHSREFRELEREYEAYDEAREWLNNNLELLLKG